MTERQLPARVAAVIFDMDGVLTDTVHVHAAAWKRLFDQFLAEQTAGGLIAGDTARPFDQREDYRRHVDGKPRHDGVRDFLASRGLALPEGAADDGPDEPTVHGLGRRKDGYFHERLRAEGARAYEDALALLDVLGARGVPIAVISASRNAVEVLASAGLSSRFAVLVDGVEADALGLAGKPAPDVFLEAAGRLGVDPRESAVLEDAIAGVAAARAGGFGLVIGVDRHDDEAPLLAGGADLAVGDLRRLVEPHDGETEVLRAARAALRGAGEAAWVLAYEGYDAASEGLREALCALGNGYFATRGASAHVDADGEHYPGTYAAGVYNNLVTEVAGHEVPHESLVNLPNWLPVTFRIDGGAWFDPRRDTVERYRLVLDMRRGVLTRRFITRDGAGRETHVAERRFVSMAHPHLAAIEVTLRPENWSGALEVRSALDGRVENAGVARYRELDGRHLEPRFAGASDPETVSIEVETTQTHVRIAQAARTRVRRDGEPLDAPRRLQVESGYVTHDLDIAIDTGDAVSVEKVVALYTSRDPAIVEPGEAARAAARRAPDIARLLEDHERAWERLWRRGGIAIDGGSPRVALVLNLHVFHLLQVVSPHVVDVDAGVPARGLHGEAYRGHIFWDELFIFPYLNLRFPDIARALLLYRYRRLEEARWAAREAGYAGAMFPWQSGLDGREVSQTMHLNPRSGRWLPDHSHIQRHIGIAVAYNTWQYWQATGDAAFMHAYGVELLVEVARFWASIAHHDPGDDRYDIEGVMGPDEYHDAYPDAAEPGLRNNAYTNVMVSRLLQRTLALWEGLPDADRDEIASRLRLGDAELERWDAISRRLRVPFHDAGTGDDGEGGRVISQFEGYEALEELDWDGYRERYGNIQRLDRLLEAEDDSTNRYKLSKQADVLMLPYLMSPRELGETLARLGYEFDEQDLARTVDYYLARTSHGSTLSQVVHSWVLSRLDRAHSWRVFLESLEADIGDVQGGTTAEGIHLGAMAGTVDLVQRGFTGLEMCDGELRFDPALPPELGSLDFEIRYRGARLSVHVNHERLCLEAGRGGPSVPVVVSGESFTLRPGQQHEIALPAGASRSE